MRGFVAFAGVLPFAVLASCSSTDTTPTPTVVFTEYASGTRLHAEVYAAGAAKLWHDWYDTQLKVQCSFGDAEDGSVRCLPSGPSVASASFYADAACTTKVALSDEACATPTYALSTPGGASCGKTAVSTIGAPFTGPTYQMNNGTCAPATTAPTAKFFSVGATVPPSAFVSGSMKTEARGAVLSVDVEHGDDGSSRVVEMYDTVLAGPCELVFQSEDGRLPEYVDRCAPTKTAFREGDFGDAACATPVAFAPGGTCFKGVRNAVQIYGKISATCAQEALLGYAQIGSAYTGDLWTNNATCQKKTSPPQPYDGYVNIGAPMPGSAMPKVTHLREGTDRIVKDWVVDDAGHKLMVVGFYDTQRKEPCFLTFTTDGKTRCAPRNVLGASGFSDAACTKALSTVYVPPAGCPADATPKIVVVTTNGVGCPANSRQRFYTVGSQVPLTETYSLNGDTCQGPNPSGTGTYLDTTEIAPDGFAELSDVTE